MTDKPQTTKNTCEKDGHIRVAGNYCVFCHKLVKPTENEAKWDAFYKKLPEDVIKRLSIHDLHRIGKIISEVFNVKS